MTPMDWGWIIFGCTITAVAICGIIGMFGYSGPYGCGSSYDEERSCKRMIFWMEAICITGIVICIGIIAVKICQQPDKLRQMWGDVKHKIFRIE